MNVEPFASLSVGVNQETFRLSETYVSAKEGLAGAAKPTQIAQAFKHPSARSPRGF
jgi:hypothetical protein